MGMIAAALVLGLRTKAAPMSDAEIMEKARQLGMVESGSLMLSDLQGQEPDSVQPVESEPVDVEPDDADEISPAGTDNGDLANPEDTDVENPTGEDDENAVNPAEPKKDVIYSDEPVLFTIDEGTNSYTVSKNLAAVGLIKDVVSFDNFLIDNGYSKSIQSGTYEILPGTSEKDIATIITGK